MCGIAGISGLGATPFDRRLRVERMLSRLRHRGPDGGGVTEDAGVAIGMRRLAIVDIEHGQQPMLSDDKTIALVHNGEIYNAPALRERLSRQGVRFQTRSDTEVILRLYEMDPDAVEQELSGMWAFAIHDRRRRRLVLSRDRFGIKPLFVARRGHMLAFASELSALDRSAPELSSAFEVDPDAAHAMLAWGYVPENATIYRGVERVAPAHRLEVDLETGQGATRPYWKLVPSAEAATVRSLDDACALVEPILRRSVREHLESDVPLAAFVSGGIDSGLVASYAAESTDIKAYTIGFREPRFDESPHARATAEKLGIPIQIEILDEQMALTHLGEVLCAYDEPFGDSSSLATYLLSRHVARDFKVALGGDGGDEVFAGYSKYRIVWLRRVLGHAPLAQRLIHAALSRLPSRVDRTSTASDLMRIASKTARGLVRRDADAYVALTELGTLAFTSKLVLGTTCATRFEEQARARFEAAGGTPLQRTLAADLASPLPNDMLTKVDRASMACSLEARVPFLDHRLAEVGLGLPERFTLGTRGKLVLRALHQRRFGPELSQRRKWGFGVPVERWLSTVLAPACRALFDETRLRRFGILAPSALSRGRHEQLVKTDGILAWHAFALAAWCEIHLGDGPDALCAMLRPPQPGAGHLAGRRLELQCS